MKKKNIYLLIIALFALFLFIVGMFYIKNQHYQMAVRVIELDENAAEFPTRKQWFDASEWLKKKRYIKVNDFYLIDTQYTPIDNLNSFTITLTIQEAINEKGGSLPELDGLVDLDAQLFFKLVKDRLSYEYVYTQFDKDTLKPTIDWFLIRFPYQEKKYEVLMRREVFNGGFFYLCFSSHLYREGVWYRDVTSLLTYKEYTANK